MQVIGELFLAAALVCLCAILPVILMRDKLTPSMPGARWVSQCLPWERSGMGNTSFDKAAAAVVAGG